MKLFYKKNASWVETKENIPDFLNAAGLDEEGEYDEEFLTQQLIEGRIKFTDKEIKVAVTDELNSGKVIEIKFLQGRYKNKVGYTLPDFVRDKKKEREQEVKKERERLAQEQAKIAEEARIKQLATEGKISVIQDGVQFTLVMDGGTNAYRKLIGKTNLPE